MTVDPYEFVCPECSEDAPRCTNCRRLHQNLVKVLVAGAEAGSNQPWCLTCVDDQGWFEGSERPAPGGGVYSLCALCDRKILHADMVIAESAGRLRPHHADCFYGI